MARTVFWVFLLAGLFSPMVNGQFTDTTDDSFVDNDDDDENAGEDADTNDYGDVFNDYFDDEMRVVDVDQDVAIKACVNNADALVNKIDSAYNKCFKDFEDWNEFQENNVGNDKDKDGLSDEYEADEACFYKKMGWVVNNEADKEAIKKDFENLNSTNVRNEFVSSIDACSGWNGKFKGRKKRDAEEDSWALSLARERRAARKEGNQKPNNGANKPNRRRRKNTKLRKDKGKNKKGTKKRERKGRGKGRNNGKNGNRKRKNKTKNNKDRNGRKGGKDKKMNRNGTGKGKGKGKGKGNGNRSKDGDKKKRKKKDNNGLSKVEKKTIAKLLPESVYNQLWCYELSVEKALEECVEAMILP